MRRNNHHQRHHPKEDWLTSKWRPMMGWMYMMVCIADFIVFPVLWSAVQNTGHGQVTLQWQPITLQGAGLFHIAMGAILGITAHGRTQEKINGVGDGAMQFPQNVGTTYTPPPPIGQFQPGGYSSPTAPATGAPTFISSTGKQGPILDEPER